MNKIGLTFALITTTAVLSLAALSTTISIVNAVVHKHALVIHTYPMVPKIPMMLVKQEIHVMLGAISSSIKNTVGQLVVDVLGFENLEVVI
jgi:uncharacterized protein YunC (DUF1805 family)